MNRVPRLDVKMGLLEFSAFARLRGAFFADLHENLPAAMKKRTNARGSSGELREAWTNALRAAQAQGFEGEDAQVVALAALLDVEADEVQNTLHSEATRELRSSSNAEQAFVMASEPDGAPPA